MKRAVVFLSFFLLLGFLSISGTSNIAFAEHGSPPSLEAAVLVCSVSPPPATTITVTAFSNPTSVAITSGEDCATALVALKEAGLVIRAAHSVNTTPLSIVYTLVNAPMDRY